MYKLKIISSTIRPGRKGPAILHWTTDFARQNGLFDVEFLDLAELNLPFMDEPNHPTMQQYGQQHTKNWSAMIGEADAFIFVTAEYNFGYPAVLRNALEYLSEEWKYKAAGIVSYGGVSAGTRAANSLKGDLATLSVVPLVEAVNIPFFDQFIDEDAHFRPNEQLVMAADEMLNQLLRWTKALKAMRDEPA